MHLKKLAPKLVVSAAASALIATPIVAQAADAPARNSAPVESAEEMAGGSGLVIGLLAAAALVAGIIIIADGDDNDDAPVSP